ncbi:MAG: hypothetical protein JSR45_17950 [Proteobacteria bacterium]|nr:hypothetical protein [Pseudomonadota bacterium]
MIGRLVVGGLLAAAGVAAATVGAEAAPPGAGPVSCLAVARQVHAEGPRAAVARLSAEHRWDGLLDRIEAGEGACVRLAPALKPGTDAATSEGLRLALGRALQTAPAEVLRLGDQAFPLAEVCRDNAIEPSRAESRRFKARATAALKQVRAPALVARRDACLRALGG